MGRIVNFSYFIFGDEEFFEVVSVGFMYLFFDLGGYALTSHTPQPLSRGEILDAAFFLEMSGLCSF